MKHDLVWIEQYNEILKKKVVLELGCGSGIDTAIISKYASRVVSCDHAPQHDNRNSVLAIDHSEELPFESGSFGTAVASLCLHYFEFEKTKDIVVEISRVLQPRGNLICRLNSHKDKNYGSVGHSEIEPGLYRVNGEKKRFFSISEIQEIFEPIFTLNEISHECIDRYEQPKYVYEFSAIKA